MSIPQLQSFSTGFSGLSKRRIFTVASAALPVLVRGAGRFTGSSAPGSPAALGLYGCRGICSVQLGWGGARLGG